MIYLIGEIIVYLLAAMLVGGGAGWLLCDWRVAHAPSRAVDDAPLPVAAARLPTATEDQAARLEVELAQARARAQQVEAQSLMQIEEIGMLSRRLAGAARRVEELERERALQNRALQVLHQQLEFAVERRVPHQNRTSGSAA